jgi:tRNA-specific 2-thiouridylase
LATAHKKDSQGICFVGKVDLPEFLAQQLAKKTGDVIEIPANFKAYHRSVPPTLEERLRKQARPYTYQATDGQVVGHHQGAHFYTIGQRKGLGIGGFKEPLFVLATDVEANLLFVGAGNQHPGLYRKTLKINTMKCIGYGRTDNSKRAAGRNTVFASVTGSPCSRPPCTSWKTVCTSILNSRRQA